MRAVTRAAAPVHARDGGEAARRRSARPSCALDGAAFGARPGGGDASASSRRCSPSRSDRQPHPPGHAPRATDAEIVAAARAAGVTRILTIGTDAESSRRAQAAAEAHDEVWFAIGHHPNSATGYTDAITDELREIARHPRCAAIGETGLDDYRDYAPRADQERAFAAHIGLARELGKPLVIHTRAADDDTIATLARDAQGLDVDPALLLDARPARGVPRRTAGGSRFAGNVTYPKARELAFAAERAPLDRILVETDAPYLTPQAVRKERNQPAFVVHTARFIAERRGHRLRGSSRPPSTRTARACSAGERASRSSPACGG